MFTRHPDAADIGNHETLRASPGWSSCPAETSCSTTSPSMGASHRNFERRRRFDKRIGIGDPHDLQGRFAAARSPPRLYLGGLRLLQVLFGNGVMLVQILARA